MSQLAQSGAVRSSVDLLDVDGVLDLDAEAMSCERLKRQIDIVVFGTFYSRTIVFYHNRYFIIERLRIGLGRDELADAQAKRHNKHNKSHHIISRTDFATTTFPYYVRT